MKRYMNHIIGIFLVIYVVSIIIDFRRNKESFFFRNRRRTPSVTFLNALDRNFLVRDVGTIKRHIRIDKSGNIENINYDVPYQEIGEKCQIRRCPYWLREGICWYCHSQRP